MGIDGVYLMVIIVTSIFGVVAIARIIADAIVRTKQGQQQLEREYLQQMLTDIQEIKGRLDAVTRERETSPVK